MKKGARGVWFYSSARRAIVIMPFVKAESIYLHAMDNEFFRIGNKDPHRNI